MAKIAFTKLGLIKNTAIKTFTWNEQEIEVKQYLPFQEKLDLIATVLNNCQDTNNFINVAKLKMFFNLEIVYRYTNINFTDKQKEDPAKLYDLLAGTFFDTIILNIPTDEYLNLYDWLCETATHIYDYRNSVYAVLDAMSTDYSNLELDAEALKEKIADPESLSLLKNVLTKLG